MSKVDRRTPLPGLTALRFFAATYVLCFHFLPRHPADPLHPNLVNRLIDAGFTGVSAFFILSGFILAYTHERVPELGRFLRARFARVYPLYLFALAWAAEPFLRDVIHFGRWRNLWALPADLLLVQDWFPHLALLVNAPAWTLSCEAFFYLIFPFCVVKLSRFRHQPVPLILALWAGELVPPLFLHVWAGHHLYWAETAYGILLMPVARVGEFLAGIVLGLHFLDHVRKHPEFLPEPPRWLLPLSLLLCLFVLSFNQQVPHEVMRNGLMIGPYSLLIWTLASSRSTILASRPLQIGGEISYGVYLLQMPYSHTLALAVMHLVPGLQRSPLWLLTIYPVAWLTYTWVEKPCRALLLGRHPSQQDKPIPTPQLNLP